MQAQKIITCTDKAGRLVDMPIFQPMQRVELILLFPDQDNPPPPQKRSPPEKLKGILIEKGDIFSSATRDDEMLETLKDKIVHNEPRENVIRLINSFQEQIHNSYDCSSRISPPSQRLAWFWTGFTGLSG